MLDREEAAIGAFIILEEPSKDMITEAASGGYYHSDLWQKDYPRIQIQQLKHYWQGCELICLSPFLVKQAEKVKKKDATQGDLF